MLLRPKQYWSKWEKLLDFLYRYFFVIAQGITKEEIENYICASNSIGKFEKFLFLYEQL